MHWMLSGIGQTIARYLERAGGGLRALHAERPGGVAGRAPARRRAAGRGQQPHLRRHQVSHPIDLVARRALCRADRRAHRRRRRAAGAGRGRPRPGRGRRAAVEIPALPHPHLPPDRADRGRLRAGLHLRRRAHRLRLRREEHLRSAALSVPAAGAAALAAAHDGARLRPSDPHHLLGADRAGVRARALSDPAEGHPPGKRDGAPRHPRNPPFVALRAARFRHLALFRAGQADHRARLRLPPHGLGAPAAHPRASRRRAWPSVEPRLRSRRRTDALVQLAIRRCGHTSARLRRSRCSTPPSRR